MKSSTGGSNVMSDDIKTQIGIKNKGRIIINNGSVEKRVPPNELDAYLADGWVRGILQSTKNKLKFTHKGFGTLNRIRIYKGNACKYIYPNELDAYLADGWVRGIPQNVRERTSTSLKQRYIKMLWVHNKNGRKLIPDEQLYMYINDGWVRGMGPTK